MIGVFELIHPPAKTVGIGEIVETDVPEVAGNGLAADRTGSQPGVWYRHLPAG